MRYLLVLWAIPIVLFWGWYGLSVNDFSFGSLYLTRGFHDHIMGIYGKLIGVEASMVPGLIAGAFIFDTAIVLAIAAVRWHRLWLPQTREFLSHQTHRLLDRVSRPAVYAEFNIEKQDFYLDPANDDQVVAETAAGDFAESHMPRFGARV